MQEHGNPYISHLLVTEVSQASTSSVLGLYGCDDWDDCNGCDDWDDCNGCDGWAVLRLYGYAEYTVTSVKAKRPYNHITLKP